MYSPYADVGIIGGSENMLPKVNIKCFYDTLDFTSIPKCPNETAEFLPSVGYSRNAIFTN